jgi:hypothetical protein
MKAKDARQRERKLPSCKKHGRFCVGDGCPICRTEARRKEDGLCLAALHHGPGHQSKTYCQVKGRHVVHRATYGSHEQTMEWREKGKTTCTGFFDEPIELK